MKLIQQNSRGDMSFTTQANALPSFQTLINSLKQKDELQLWAKYIFYMADYDSPYSVFPESERAVKVKKELLKDEKAKVPTGVNTCVELYRELCSTESLRLLEAAKGAVHRLTSYFNSVDISDDNVKEVMDSLKKLKDVILSLDVLNEQVKKERISDTGATRGGGSPSKREE